jgi:hypothetical protein
MVREKSQNAEWRCDQEKRVTRIKKEEHEMEMDCSNSSGEKKAGEK